MAKQAVTVEIWLQ